MISVRISDPVSLNFVASPADLASHGRPERPDDLIPWLHQLSSRAVHLLDFEQDGTALQRAVHASFVAHDVDVMLMPDAALRGIGIACPITEQASAHLLSGDLI
jgi:hypothetical protein